MSDYYEYPTPTTSAMFKIAALNPFSIFVIASKTFPKRDGTIVTKDVLYTITTTEGTLRAVKEHMKVGDSIFVSNATIDGVEVDSDGKTYIQLYAPRITFAGQSLKNQVESHEQKKEILAKFTARRTRDGLTLNQSSEEAEEALLQKVLARLGRE